MRLFQIFLLVVCSFAAIPQIKLCAGLDEDCRTVSRIALGTLSVGRTLEGKRDMRDPEAVAEWLEAAADLGFTFLDMADVYPIKRASEDEWRTSVPILGQALALREGLRDRFYINCKMAIEDVKTDLYLPVVDISVEYIEGQIEWFREQLNIDTLDSVMIHMPETLDLGHSLDNEGMAKMFKDKKDAGHVEHFGVANWNIDEFSKFEEALSVYDISLTSLQNEINVWSAKNIEKNNAYMFDHGKTVQGWSALAGEAMGDLNRVFEETGGNILKQRKRERINENLEQIANDWGTTPNVVALSFVLRSGSHVIGLVGTTNITRLEQLSVACDYLEKWTDDLWLTVASDAGIDCGYFGDCFVLPPLDQVSTSLEPYQPPAPKTKITECSTCTCVDPGTTPYELGIRNTYVIDLTQATFCASDQYFFHGPEVPMMGTSGVRDTSEGHYYANTTVVVQERSTLSGCHTLEVVGLQTAPAPEYYVNPDVNCKGRARPSTKKWTDIRLNLDFNKVKNHKASFLELCTTAIDVEGVTCEDARHGSTIIRIASNNQTNLQKARNNIEKEGLKLNSQPYGNTVFIKQDSGAGESDEGDDINNEGYIAGIILLVILLSCAGFGMFYFYNQAKGVKISSSTKNGVYTGMN